MTTAELITAWHEAQLAYHDGGNFYAVFAEKAGLDEAEVKQHFRDWNELPHEQVVAIAERQGTTVREGGFQAYLAEVLGG